MTNYNVKIYFKVYLFLIIRVNHKLDCINIILSMNEETLKTKYGQMKVLVSNYPNRKNTIVLLHGWGMKKETFLPLAEKLKGFNYIICDFLGFGESEEPNIPLTLNDYVECVREVIKEYNVTNNLYLVGHSFGGRVAIAYCTKYEVTKVFLVNAKAFKNKTIKHKIKIMRYKLIKRFYKIFNKRKYNEYIKDKGSSDYKALSNVMKKTFVNIVNFDLKKHLKKIKCDVVVLGSINDTIVTYDETVKIHKLIKNSKLYPFFCSGHFSYIDEERKVINIINREVRGDI